MTRRILSILIIIGCLFALMTLAGWYYLFRQVPLSYASDEEHFKYGSIGTEEKQGIPYWIWLVLPRIFADKLPGPGGYASLGLIWEEGKETPVGFTKRTIGFERVGLNCAACHTATYRLSARVKPTIVPTGPSSRYDVQSYLRFLGACAADSRFNADLLLEEIKYHHELSWVEAQLYRWILIPQTRKALQQQSAEFTWMDSRARWGPGRIDPFNPVKFRVLKQPVDDTIGNSDMMAIWNRKAKKGFALHWDGLETSLIETIRTGAIGDGADKHSFDKHLAGLDRIERFIMQREAPQYPFDIDRTLAEHGKTIFEQQCASCHALGGARTGQVIPVTESGLGTDRHRLDMWTQAAADTYNQFGSGYAWKFKEVRKVEPAGFVAVLLDGLWLRAPYLHNGSVPSLRDLLTAPDRRAKKFYRGCDLYDPVTVGFVSDGADVKRIGFEYDTSLPGNSNQGHLWGTELPNSDKQALIEYLKTL